MLQLHKTMYIKRQWVFLLPLFAVIWSGCPFPQDELAIPETNYVPLFMTRTQLEASVKSQSARKLTNPGKFILYNNFIFLNEKYEGVHVIDNTNPAAPVKLSFISIPGCIDVSIRNDKLVADNAVDLVVLDIFNKTQVVEVQRKPNTFPEMNPPDMGELPDKYKKENRDEGLIIVGWEAK